jgi:hypothetical protein
MDVINLLLTLVYGISIFNFIITDVKSSHKSFIILPTLLFRFMPRLDDNDGRPLPRLKPGLRLFKEVLLLKLRRLKKPFNRALIISGPKLTRSRKSFNSSDKSFFNYN